MRCWLAVLIALMGSLSSAPAQSPRPSDAGLAFFEQKIRPVLIQHCYACHSAEAKKARGGLQVDSRAALLQGGDSGPAIVPGKPLASLLLKALRHDGLAMPPKERLSAEIVADFEKWIAQGAPDPRDGRAASATAGIDLNKGKQFWAFQPPRPHQPPAVPADSAIDAFILAALKSKGLQPAPLADRAVLLRRLCLDLTGLPPSPAQLEAFLADQRPDAYERLVDSLLASPAFGECWGRHWLDVVRYADSNGKDENLTFHEAFRFRDYVVRSFNHDKPFDQLIREHIAGDLLPAATPQQREDNLIGTGFLVLGPKVLADRDQLRRKMDVVDEQIDTIGKAFLGLTLGCARCHDHKFDPVPTTDYYALAGIFASTRTLDGFKRGNPIVSGWMLRPLDADGEEALARRKAHEAKIKSVTDQLRNARNELKTVEDRASMRVPGKLVGFVVDDSQARLIGTWKASTFSRPYVGVGYVHDDRSGKGEKSAVFTPKLPKAGLYDVLISYTTGASRANNVPVSVRHAEGTAEVLVDQTKKPAIDGLFHKIGTYSFAAGDAAQVTISNRGTTGHVIVDAVRFVPTGELAKDPEMAMGVLPEVKQQLADVQQRIERLVQQEKQLKASLPPQPRLAMAVRDEAKPADAHVAIRGNPHQLGAVVPRGFLQVASWQPAPVLPAEQSGRRELADWLADPRNPLTARVFVNRVWLHLFGEGLVRTPDNFGVQGERPTHPELLDYLTLLFQANDYSPRRLIRHLVLSRTYRQAVIHDKRAAQIDPENRLLWTANRRRLQAEVLRDAMLAVAGTLDRTMGGSAVANLGEVAIDNSSQGGVSTEDNVRRSVYLPIIRNDLPAFFEVFDFADPDVTTGRRDTTTVPTQALYLLNSPFVLAQARATADRLLAEVPEESGRVQWLYRHILGRNPTSEEQRQITQFVAGYGSSPREAWAAACQALFGCTEFRFVE
jgi:cytochrome c553